VNPELAALLTHARWMSADQRAIVADAFRATQPVGSLLVATCHRVELYGIETELAPLTAGLSGVHTLRGSDAARQLIGLAVGRDSAVIGEDQILYQLRIAARGARQSGVVAANLDRLVDLSLRAGRRARSWLPANRPTLVDVAIDRVGGQHGMRDARVHVVGAGAMGRAAVASLLARGSRVSVGSRTAESAKGLADRFGIPHIPFVPSR
jgi:glutamyl-tRNA reductase